MLYTISDIQKVSRLYRLCLSIYLSIQGDPGPRGMNGKDGMMGVKGMKVIIKLMMHMNRPV